MINKLPTPQEAALAGMPKGETDFLQSLKNFIQTARESKDRDLAQAARQWGRVLEFRVQVTLQHRRRRLTQAQGA
jgi:hypothetical protein